MGCHHRRVVVGWWPGLVFCRCVLLVVAWSVAVILHCLIVCCGRSHVVLWWSVCCQFDDNEQRTMTNVVVHHLVATLLSAMWHLILMSKNGLGGGDISAHLGIVRCGCCLTLLSIAVACLIVTMSGTMT